MIISSSVSLYVTAPVFTMMCEPAAGWWQLVANTNNCDAVKRPQKHSGLRQTDKTAQLLLEESDQTATLCSDKTEFVP